MNTLKHYGVKGQRWGVRKLQDVGGELVLKKGSVVHHVSSEQALALKAKHPLYISFTEKDQALYKGSYSQDLRIRTGLKNIMDHKLVAKQDLVSPTKKRAVEEFLKLRADDKDLLSTMGSDKIKASFFLSAAKYIGFDSTKANTKRYQKLVDSKNPKDQEKVFEDFVTFAAFSEKTRKQYFARLQKEGFNSIYDYNDMRGGFADKPLIIFDSNKTLKIKGASTINPEQTQKFLKDYKEITGIDMGLSLEESFYGKK